MKIQGKSVQYLYNGGKVADSREPDDKKEKEGEKDQEVLLQGKSV